MIARFITGHLQKTPEKLNLKTSDKAHKRINKNAPEIKNFNQIAYQYFDGVDLLAIEGLSHATVLAIMGEIGPDGFSKFNSSKEFASWMRLAPNNKISGGKVLSTKDSQRQRPVKDSLTQCSQCHRQT